MAVGTPVFMAPEILRGQPPVAQSDLYALGVIFFRLLCGRLPIPVQDSGATLAELFGPVLHAHETGLPRVSSVEPEIPEWLDELVARLLDKDPQVRPDNGADLARLLEHRRSFSEPGLPARAKADSGATSSAPPDARTSEPTNAPSSAPPGARTSDPPPEAEISSPNPLTVTGDLLPVAISSQGAVTVLTGGMSSTGAAVLPQSALQNLSGELPAPGRARGSTIPLMALTAAVVAGLFFFLMKPPDPVAPATVSTPEKATPAKQVLVSFSSEPEGAIVMVEGRKLCSKTPCSGPVAPGHRYVTMRLEGHETYDAVVEVGADATGVHAKLKPKFGTISLVAPTRKNVVVWVDGEEWGTTPVEGRRVTPGRHVVEIRDRRYKKTTMTLGIEAGEQRQVVLRPAPVPAAPSGTPKEPKVGADDGFDRIFEMPEDN